MRLTWLTDIHLDFITSTTDIAISNSNLDVFSSMIMEEQPDACVITGDISRAPLLNEHLISLETRLNIPIYFVLGNHDFWGANIDDVRRNIVRLTQSSRNIRYLSLMNYVMLNDQTALIGHDGWYDALYGEPQHSNFVMNDWLLIGDFARAGAIVNRNINLSTIVRIARTQASIATQHIMSCINNVLVSRNPKKIIIATHVPPFIEPLQNSKGAITDMLPWYASKILGNMLLSIAKINQNTQFEVICGHCHTGYEQQITKNIRIYSGHAQYSHPLVQRTFEI